MADEIKYVVGVDEVGRGPIAGPVAVCAFKLPITDYQTVRRQGELLIENAKEELKVPLRDSKKLSRKQREIWFEFLKKEKEKGNCDYAVSFVSPENIDKFGIAKCIQKALNDSLLKITKSNSLEPNHYSLMLDGGLKAPEEYIYQETIIKGDESHPIISLASIIAKVSRDRIMYRYAKEFPEYGLDKHVGYGTKAHYEAIAKHGQLPIHRKSFIH